MKILKRILYIFLILLFAAVIWQFDNVIYGIKQLRGQMHIIWNARPVEDVLKDPSFNAEYRKKLELISEIRHYAVDSLGLEDSKNYTTFYDQEDKPVLWVLTACHPFEFTPYEWHFPFLGNVPYKGFFRKELAEEEEKKMRRHVLDVDLSTTGGWSTLGFFKDPVLSNMLKRSEGQLAELIIHELTHATVYIPGSADFNENLATFIGEQGAIRFLESHYGKGSPELVSYVNFLEDEEVFGNYMLQSTDTLEHLYKTHAKDLWREKMRLKYLKILEITEGIRQLPLHYPERYVFEFPKHHLPDNTWFMSFRRYRGKQEMFRQGLEEHKGNFRKYLESLLKK